MRFRDWLITLATVVAVALSIFAVGGVLRWTQAIVAIVAAIAVAATTSSQRGLARLSPLVALLGIATALTFLQLLPLPDSLVEALSPTMTALRSDGAELLDVAPWTAFTGDVGATLGALVVLLTLLGIALATLRIATSETGRYRIIASIGALCGITAVVTGIHKLFGLRALYGIYEPEHARPIMLGPLLNSNSLACLMAVGALLAIGLAAHRRQRAWLRALWLLVVLACGAVMVATVSRGATIAFVAGALITVAVLLAQRFAGHDRSRKRRVRFLSNALPMGVLAGCLVILVIYSNAGNVERQLSQLSFDELHYSRSKFAAWRSATTLIEESPWLGAGRGAFEASFTRVHDASGLATYGYLENEYLQAAVDWGVPGALMLGLAAIWLAYVAARRWRDSALSAGALGALTVVAMQSNVDFGLQFLGLAAPVTAIAACLAYVPLRPVTRPWVARTVRLSHAVGLLIGAALLFSSITTTLDEDRRVLARGASLDEIRESIERHPLDYYGYAVAAELLHRGGDPRAIRLLNHAMALHPTHPQLHRMAARMLYAEGYISQSTIEYAAALQTTPKPRALLTEILVRFPREQAASAMPIDYTHPEVLVRLLDELARPDVARAWLARVLALRPNSARACDLMYEIAQRGDLEAAEVAGRRCSDRLPDFQSRLALARLLISKQGHAEAIRLLQDVESWQCRRDDKINAWLALCDSYKALAFIHEAKRCLRRLDASADMLNERRGEILKRLEAIHALRDAAGSAAPADTGSAATGSAAAP